MDGGALSHRHEQGRAPPRARSLRDSRLPTVKSHVQSDKVAPRAEPLFERVHCERRRLACYSGVSEQTALVYEPASVEELAAVFAAARQLGVRCTLRGAGYSFHDQAQSAGWVVCTSRLNAFRIDAEACELIAQPGVRWGDVVAASEPLGLVPRSVVTTSHTSVGGTLSGGCLSRFSPTVGKEGSQVKRLTLLTIEGELIECTPPASLDPRRWSREERAFAAAIGGLGMVGCIVEAVIRLERVCAPGAPLAVWSRVSKIGQQSRLASRLLPRPNGPIAISAVLFPGSDGRMGLFFESSYVVTPRRRRMLTHKSDAWLRTALEWGMRVPALTSALWSVIYRCFREQTEFVDDVPGFLFFMDGNVRAKALAQQAGIDLFTVQQTFVLPAESHARETGAAHAARLERECETFLAGADTLFAQRALVPTVIDLLYLPADHCSYLSPTLGRAGIAVSFAFEVSREEVDAIARALTTLCELCAEVGGKTYLVKNVFVRSETLRAMYGEGLDGFLSTRAELDPRSLLGSDLFSRLGLDHPQASSHSGTRARVRLDGDSEAPPTKRSRSVG
jgi:decaprenylphospho-beta-D-ribofuranose 2-oxidase